MKAFIGNGSALGGGASDTIRITYQAAWRARRNPLRAGQRVDKGPGRHLVRGHSQFGFRRLQPYADPIQGDWFNPRTGPTTRGRLPERNWLLEAATLEDALKPVEGEARWFGRVDADTTTIWAQFPG